MMIAGEITTFKSNEDDTGTIKNCLIELTEWGDPFIEIAVEIARGRAYLKFRLSDLLREIEEAKNS